MRFSIFSNKKYILIDFAYHISMPKNFSSLNPIILIGILKAISKWFMVLFMILLPIFHYQWLIDTIELWYLGTLLIGWVIVGSLFISLYGSKFSFASLVFGGVLFFGCGLMCLWFRDYHCLLIIAYILPWIGMGMSGSIFDSIGASLTKEWKRFKSFSYIAMIGDVMRISYPLIFGRLYTVYGVSFVVIISCVILFVYIVGCVILVTQEKFLWHEMASEPIATHSLLSRNFSSVLFISFLDSIASSQLFVFLPLLLLFKWFAFGDTLIMQSLIFVGYMSGRWLVGILADKIGGFLALKRSEVGMIVTILLLMLMPVGYVTYVICRALWVATRGTSPVISSLVFDQIDKSHYTRGSSIHTIVGYTWDAVGQFMFALLAAYFGYVAPFRWSVVVCVIVVLFIQYRQRFSHGEG